MQFDKMRKDYFINQGLRMADTTKHFDENYQNWNISANMPVCASLSPPMQSLSSINNNYRAPPQYRDYRDYRDDIYTGSGITSFDANNNILLELLKRNSAISLQNRQLLQNSENIPLINNTSTDAANEPQKQSLEIYFNELQDAGFGGSDINRENTRKALFNLKAVGTDLDINTINRFQDIVSEFIDSFIVSVENPQFNELIKGNSSVTGIKYAEVIKKSINNLDAIENVLRINKVLDVLENSYDLQESDRIPNLEANFNEIIKAKKSNLVPTKLRTLINSTNKTLENIKSKLVNIHEMRDNIGIDGRVKKSVYDKSPIELVDYSNDLVKATDQYNAVINDPTISTKIKQKAATYVTKSAENAKKLAIIPLDRFQLPAAAAAAESNEVIKEIESDIESDIKTDIESDTGDLSLSSVTLINRLIKKQQERLNVLETKHNKATNKTKNTRAYAAEANSISNAKIKLTKLQDAKTAAQSRARNKKAKAKAEEEEEEEEEDEEEDEEEEEDEAKAEEEDTTDGEYEDEDEDYGPPVKRKVKVKGKGKGNGNYCNKLALAQGKGKVKYNLQKPKKLDSDHMNRLRNVLF